MRTFHIGGTASRVAERSFIKSKEQGTIKYHNLKLAQKKDGFVVLNRNGLIAVCDEQGREIQKNPIPQGSLVLFPENETVDKDKIFVRWDPYSIPILTEVTGKVRYEDLIDGITVQEELNLTTNRKERVVIEYKGDYHPQIVIVSDDNEVLGIYPIPTGAHIMAEDGSTFEAGDILAKIPRLVVKTRDITGGLPRVAELFEARRPKAPAVVSEIEGYVEFAQGKGGERNIIVRSPTGMQREYTIPPGKHPIVYRGDKVTAGQQLTDGPIVLQDILRVCGDKVLQEYLVNEVQEIYRLQGVRINDKHIELIIREMLKKVRVVTAGDTEFLPSQVVDKWDFRKENERVVKKGGKPASASPFLLGITKASLATKSFISAASFQETTRVLTEAATSGKTDELLGLKENVIVGHLIPAGTGLYAHRNINVKVAGAAPDTKEAAPEQEAAAASAAKKETTKETKKDAAKATAKSSTKAATKKESKKTKKKKG
jgi:DNA-directed RNA polymerase subunit beta'